ncbi:MAG: ATP-binding protein [Verrucomicrobiales bacterium]|nr:ATP-binding protein [Verrucomicrobiales bacterium]
MKLTQSLRWQMQFWHGLVLAVALAGFGVIAFRYQRSSDLKQIDLALEREITVLIENLRSDARPPRGPLPPPRQHRPRIYREYLASEEAKNLLDKNGLEDDYVILWRRNGSKLASLGDVPNELPVPEAAIGERTSNVQRTRGEFREVYRYLKQGECLLLGKSIQSDTAQWYRLGWQLAGSGLGILGLGLVGGWLFLSRAIQPIQAISQSASQFAGGNLETRIPTDGRGGELGQLTSDLNETFEQLEEAFARQSRFTADAAHELRTPVSVILSHAQAALAREREASAYKEALTTCERGAKRLQQLIDSLLTLSTLDAKVEESAMETVDLASITHGAAAFLRPLLDQRQLSLETQLDPARCDGSVDQLHQVLMNLLSNAIQFSDSGQVIRLSTGFDEAFAWARVVDEGKGIAPEHLPHLFERFYRAESSRRRQAGGAGLGMAICQEIVKGHSGSIQVESKEGVGTTVLIQIPVAAES